MLSVVCPVYRSASTLNELHRCMIPVGGSFGENYSPEGKKLDRLVSIVSQAGADRHVSGPAAKDYIQESAFSDIGIEVLWKSYSGYPEYPQFFPPFKHGVSILDLLFHTGPEASWYIWGWRDQLVAN